VGILIGILNSLIVFTSLILICLVLIQRGKGGGLAGAFGGVGGSSAFGTKAGDVFTRVTMCVAGFWILLAMILVVIGNQGGESAWGSDSTTKVSREAPASPGGAKGAGGASKPSAPASPAADSKPASAAPTSVPAIPPDAKK
jgi:preprotein translocase subunit SecG